MDFRGRGVSAPVHAQPGWHAGDRRRSLLPRPIEPRPPGDPPGTQAPGHALRQTARQRQWPRRLGRALTRVDVWILIATVAGAVIAYLTLVKLLAPPGG